MEECFKQQNSVNVTGAFCNVDWDSIICWPMSKNNTTVHVSCPRIKTSDTSRTISRFCDNKGMWKHSINDNRSIDGPPDLSKCYTREVLGLLEQLAGIPVEEYKLKISIGKIVRCLELAGLFVSLMILIVSFVVYSSFRTLRNARTRIHMHFFAAVLCRVIIKLIILIDQMILSSKDRNEVGFDNTPILCEVIYGLLEYFKSATGMWMFVEAIHLYNAVGVTATKMHFKKSYMVLGWGISGAFSICWVVAMIMNYPTHCWFGYNYNHSYWILEVPRILVLLTNTYYLIRIVNVVFVKLKYAKSSEAEKLRKTAKSTLTLFPLLGITNYIGYAEPKLNCSLEYFILYCIVYYLLMSFHGAMIGLIYCLLTQEVKTIIANKLDSLMGDQRSTEQNSKLPKNDISCESCLA